MKLYLKNFKCFEEAEFIFEQGITLIEGPSGSGKSTIFDALRFVMWGSRDTDIIKFGSKKCEVILEYKSYKILRTKNPNFLKVSFEGVEIQDPQKFMEIHFSKYVTNFLSLTFQKQIQILENLISSDLDIELLKTNIKNIISEGNKKYSILISAIDTLEQTIKKIPAFEKDLKEPEKMDLGKLSLLKKEESKIILNRNLIEHYKSELTRVEPINEQITEDYSEIINDLIVKMERIKKNKIKISNMKILENDVDLLNTINEEINDTMVISLENKNIRKKINMLLSKCSRKYNIEKIEEIKQEHEAKYKAKYNCPNCHVDLDLIDQQLVLVNKDFGFLNQIKELKEQQREEKDLKFLEKRKEELLKSIQYRKEINVLKNEILDEKETKDQLEIYSKKQENFKKFKELTKKLSEINKPDNLEEIQREISLLENYQKNLEIWKQNEQVRNMFSECQAELFSKKNEAKNVSHLLKQLEEVKNNVEISQQKSFEGIISELNKHVNFFCEKFFEENIFVKFSGKKHLDIFYKGHEYKLSQFSTGELARLNLAVDLSLYKICGTTTPLMLDEVSSNLDSETSTKIFKIIQQNFNETVLVIAHQVIEGMFDNILIIE